MPAGSESKYDSPALATLASSITTSSSESLSNSQPPMPRSSTLQSSVALLTGSDLSPKRSDAIAPKQPSEGTAAVQEANYRNVLTLEACLYSMQAASTEPSTLPEASGERDPSIAANAQPRPFSFLPSTSPVTSTSIEGAPEPGPIKESKTTDSALLGSTDNLATGTAWRREQPGGDTCSAPQRPDSAPLGLQNSLAGENSLAAGTTWRREQHGENPHERFRRPGGVPQRRGRTPIMPPVGEPGALNFAARRQHGQGGATEAKPAPPEERAAPRYARSLS